MRYLYSLNSRAARKKAGSKAANLHFLLRHGFLVPEGWVVSGQAQADFQQQGELVLNQLRGELSKVIKPELEYAVRSSCTAEDNNQNSCAGQFLSQLRVKGIEAILDTVQKVWHSLEAEPFAAYKQTRHLKDESMQMGVIIQKMIHAECSGVVFSKNPLTGLSETIIEAGRGTGDEQVESAQNPERWVSKWGLFQERPESGILGEKMARELVQQTRMIALKYRQPVDLEWAIADEKMYFLQVRPITRLDIPVFSNRISKEVLPGVIKPLVWSVNTQLINQIWVNILNRLTGDHRLQPESLTGHFYYRAYFNMAVFGQVFEKLGMPYEALELLFGLESDGPDKPHMRPGAGVVKRLPQLFLFTIQFFRAEKQFISMYEQKKKAYQQLVDRFDQVTDPESWLKIIGQVFHETKPVAYFNIMLPIQTMMYHRLLGSKLKCYGYDIRKLELAGVAQAQSQYSPQGRIQQLHRAYFANETALSDKQKKMLAEDISQFLEEFGHFSDSGNDCSVRPWRENPELILRMIADSQSRQDEKPTLLSFSELRLPWPKRAWLRMLYRRASRFAVHREVISSLYTYGYGQFRTCFIRLGEHFVQAGILDDPEEVFYLYWAELLNLVQSKTKKSMQDLVSSRKKEICLYQDAILPDLIFGSEQPPLTGEHPSAWRGIPTSLGQYTGPARVLHGLADFSELKTGDVLIIPYSDVGWTPLFSKAGAVIAESGGMLSHSSIIAREYHIPAVVSVSGACHIKSGTQVTVNGYTGEIICEQDPAEDRADSSQHTNMHQNRQLDDDVQFADKD